MTKWKLQTYCFNLVQDGSRQVSNLWEHKDAEGNSAWDTLQKFSAEGWELVTVTPIVVLNSGQTGQLLYTFKAPIEVEPQAKG